MVGSTGLCGTRSHASVDGRSGNLVTNKPASNPTTWRWHVGGMHVYFSGTRVFWRDEALLRQTKKRGNRIPPLTIGIASGANYGLVAGFLGVRLVVADFLT